MPFEQLPTRAQVHRLRATAFEVLRSYPIDVARLRLLNHGYNTTFRVDTTDGQRFALRLNTNSRKTSALLAAEMAWLAALRADTDLTVPSPQPTVDGAFTVEVSSPDLGRVLPAALFAWLPGPDLSDAATPAAMREVGRITATLHAHTEQWSLPPGAELPPIDTVLMNVPYHLDSDHPLLTPARRELIEAAFARCQAGYDSLLARARRQVLHADIHLANLKTCRGRIALFDFDDCGIGVAAQDLAITAYYLRPRVELEDALLDGYQTVRPLPAFTADQFEAVVASRNLVLLNDLFTTLTAELRELLPTYVANSEIKLRHYLDTGTYRHDLPGAVPLW